MPASNVRRRVMAMLFLLSMITYLDRVCMNVAIPSMSEELGLSLSQRGWVLGIFALAYGIFEIPGGLLVQRLTNTWKSRRRHVID